jgi:hypothetical protein
MGMTIATPVIAFCSLQPLGQVVRTVEVGEMIQYDGKTEKNSLSESLVLRGVVPIANVSGHCESGVKSVRLAVADETKCRA